MHKMHFIILVYAFIEDELYCFDKVHYVLLSKIVNCMGLAKYNL